MRGAICLFIVCYLAASLFGCTGERASTPREVEVQFHSLLDSLDQDSPGASVAALEAFVHQYGDYDIADTAQVEIDRFRAETEDRYHEARELARDGDFDRAEHILVDLADHLADTPDGENAQRFLEFEFYFSKAKWMMVHQRFEECGAVARELLEGDLTAYQSEQVEMILDNVGYANTAVSMSERANAQNACRQLSMMLTQRFVEEGLYPQSLSLSDVEDWESYSSESIIRGLSAIEDFKTSTHTFSFVGVSSSGRHRIRVEDGRIEN